MQAQVAAEDKRLQGTLGAVGGAGMPVARPPSARDRAKGAGVRRGQTLMSLQKAKLVADRQRSPAADFFRPGLGEKMRRPSPKFINSTRRTWDKASTRAPELGTSPVKFLDRGQEKNTLLWSWFLTAQRRATLFAQRAA